MLKGFYTAASGMIAQQRRTEILTNNLGNANTPGFKADLTAVRSFPNMLLSRIDGEATGRQGDISPVGSLGTGVYVQETLPNFGQGSLRETAIPTDIALTNGVLPEGSAIFFRLEGQDGELYTRNGSFTLDASGDLVNPQGFYVLSDTGERIRLANDDFTVTAEGFIRQNGADVARIGVALSLQPEQLTKTGNGLFQAAGGALPSAYGGAADFSLRQGFLEQSNVDAARTMTDLMAAYRTFEANQKVLQAYDRSMERAVNEIGRVN
ncbi:flagellar hook-basal body protein [Indiicoccus explosivorum]|uniref:flagellar hook-basal body protein n=1 Tax=Indiicoccus explosivorum TaxID=1917864 RepID=UPI000B42DD6A|nr:flagellar hook-basal body protein [Indiicoccus explosivorum]